jgi:hypothetical protein
LAAASARAWTVASQLSSRAQDRRIARLSAAKRERLLFAASHIQHMQKALMQMNLQLHHVVSDMRIIRAFVAGERDPARLAVLEYQRCKASAEAGSSNQAHSPSNGL